MDGLKQTLQAGNPQVMVDTSFNSPSLVEHLGRIGFRTALIDCEHGSASVETVDNLARAARAANMYTIARAETLAPHTLIRYLDCGVDGLMVPLVHNADMARRFVDIVRYSRPNTHQDILKVAMVESAEGIANIDDLIAVDGIDVLFLARVDLSKSLGHGGDKSHPEVREMIDGAVAKVRKAGKMFGLGGDYGDVGRVIQTGASLVYVSARLFLTRGAELYQSDTGLSFTPRA